MPIENALVIIKPFEPIVSNFEVSKDEKPFVRFVS